MIRTFTLLASVLLFAGCAHQLSGSGPSLGDLDAATVASTGPVQVVNIDAAVASRLQAQRRSQSFADGLKAEGRFSEIGLGDTIEVTIWEAPPATLFGGAAVDVRAPSTTRGTQFPEQVVDRAGQISVPFAGRIQVAGLSPQAVEAQIIQRLKGKANQPEVLVRVLRNASSTVTVVGEVANSIRVPLTPSGERLLDVLAAAGGVRQSVNKTTLQITRGRTAIAMSLDTVIRDPDQNVRLQAGDVVTALTQPYSFTALGATGRNEEIAFEAQGLSLAQALARAGGLNDSRASARGVFLFRFESAQALDWPKSPVASTPDGQVPVVYRIDLTDPASFFVMQNFMINHRDVLYVSNAPAAELQKFLNLIFSIAYPVLTTISVTR